MSVGRLRLQALGLQQKRQCFTGVVLHTKQPSQKQIASKVVRIDVQSLAIRFFRVSYAAKIVIGQGKKKTNVIGLRNTANGGLELHGRSRPVSGCSERRSEFEMCSSGLRIQFHSRLQI